MACTSATHGFLCNAKHRYYIVSVHGNAREMGNAFCGEISSELFLNVGCFCQANQRQLTLCCKSKTFIVSISVCRELSSENQNYVGCSFYFICQGHAARQSALRRIYSALIRRGAIR